MNEYTIYLVDDDNTNSEIIVSADSFEISKDGEYVYFQHGMKTIGFFKMSEIIGIAMN